MATGVPLDRNTKQSKSTSGFRLEYDGKKTEEEILNLPKSKLTSKLTYGSSKSLEGWNNRLYYGDNLGILLSLLDDPNVRGRVKLIYIDPPFATKSKFKSRKLEEAYNDDLFGSQFLEFLRERLIILRELLAPDGSIYVHLDENMAFPVKIIMDEVFDSKNYRNWITRKKCNPKNYTRNQYGNVSDYIMFYTKSDNYTWNRPYEAWSEETIKKEYAYIDEKTGRRYKKVPIHAPGTRNGETGKMWRGMMPPPGKHWQYRPETLDEMDKNGEIYWSPTGNPRRKVFLNEETGIPIQDIWLNFKDAHNQNIKITGYPTEKNISMLNQIVLASSDQNDLVLDCFCGSGTTLEASEKNNRRWIGIDSGFVAIETTINRLTRGTKPMGDFVKKESSLVEQTSLFEEETAPQSFDLYFNNDDSEVQEKLINIASAHGMILTNI